MSVEWTAPAIVLDARPYGEGGAVATVLTAEHGRHRGLAKGGSARGQTAVWQPGNLIECRWVARLSDQLGAFNAELVHPGAALAMEDAAALAILASACAVAEGALPEREAHPRVFDGLLRLILRLGEGEGAFADYVAWETVLLAEIGYGMDLSACAVTGGTDDLAFVSPRTGRAVSRDAAGVWAERLLPLPAFLRGPAASGPEEWRDGLRLTGHFLERDAFGLQHRPLPQARILLADRLSSVIPSRPVSQGPEAPG